jgi:hypothetical protein
VCELALSVAVRSQALSVKMSGYNDTISDPEKVVVVQLASVFTVVACCGVRLKVEETVLFIKHFTCAPKFVGGINLLLQHHKSFPSPS